MNKWDPAKPNDGLTSSLRSYTFDSVIMRMQSNLWSWFSNDLTSQVRTSINIFNRFSIRESMLSIIPAPIETGTYLKLAVVSKLVKSNKWDPDKWNGEISFSNMEMSDIIRRNITDKKKQYLVRQVILEVWNELDNDAFEPMLGATAQKHLTL